MRNASTLLQFGTNLFINCPVLNALPTKILSSEIEEDSDEKVVLHSEPGNGVTDRSRLR
jgi:hypothetical protein